MTIRWLAAVLLASTLTFPLSADEEEAAVPPEIEIRETAPGKLEAVAPPAPAVFSSGWKEASADEKTAFMDAYPEIRSKVQEKWDKATAQQRKDLLKRQAQLANRPLRHRWSEATPEERVAFLSTVPDMRARLQEQWELLTPDQKLQITKKRPYAGRVALYHSWADATGEEKAAFLESQPDLRRGAGQAWGIVSTSGHTTWNEATPEEKSQFLEGGSQLQDKVRERWKEVNPQDRARLVQKWSGWKLKPTIASKPAAGKPATAAPKVKGKKSAMARD